MSAGCCSVFWMSSSWYCRLLDWETHSRTIEILDEVSIDAMQVITKRVQRQHRVQFYADRIVGGCSATFWILSFYVWELLASLALLNIHDCSCTGSWVSGGRDYGKKAGEVKGKEIGVNSGSTLSWYTQRSWPILMICSKRFGDRLEKLLLIRKTTVQSWSNEFPTMMLWVEFWFWWEPARGSGRNGLENGVKHELEPRGNWISEASKSHTQWLRWDDGAGYVSGTEVN